MTRLDVFAQPLDACLLQLRAAGLRYRSTDDLKIWTSNCPACRWPGYSLTIREPYVGGPITLRCDSRCSDGEIRAALDVAAREIDPFALEIAEDAARIAAQAVELAARLASESPATDLKAAA
jgi:hypothetical protein